MRSVISLAAIARSSCSTHSASVAASNCSKSRTDENISNFSALPRSFLNSRLKRWKTPTKRSEEHTSELQSRLHLVCRLLLEKKKKKITTLSMFTKNTTLLHLFFSQVVLIGFLLSDRTYLFPVNSSAYTTTSTI